MRDIEALTRLVKSSGWKELKKVFNEEKLKLADKIIDKPEENRTKEAQKYKNYNEFINKIENIVKSDELSNSNGENSLSMDGIPSTLDN